MDEKDKLILFELLQDCKQPVSKIAKVVKLPQQTVSYRIKKLEDSKVIKKYTINVNYPKLGYSRHSLYLDVRGVSAKEVDTHQNGHKGITPLPRFELGLLPFSKCRNFCIQII